MDLLTKFKSFDFETGILQLHVLFEGEELLKFVEDVKTLEGFLRTQIKPTKQNVSISYRQQKRLFAVLRTVLKHNQQSEDVLADFYYQIKLSFFPVRYFEIGGERTPIPVSLSELSHDQLKDITTKIIAQYEDAGVHFE